MDDNDRPRTILILEISRKLGSMKYVDAFSVLPFDVTSPKLRAAPEIEYLEPRAARKLETTLAFKPVPEGELIKPLV
jgi:hypothetical protein